MTYWSSLLGADVRQVEGRYSTRVLDCGRGPVLVLLHGTGGHLENWARNIPRLAQHFRVLALDFLWHGRSQVTGFDPQIVPVLVDQVLDVLNVLGIEHASVEGQSLGGWVAMRLALASPTRIERLVLTNPMGYAPDDGAIPGLQRPDRAANLPSSLRLLDDPSPENVRDRMSRIVHDPACLTDEAVEVRTALYSRRELREVQRRFMTEYLSGQVVLRHTVTDALAGSIVHPTLVYWGAADRHPLALGRRLADRIPDARLHVAADTGHWAQYESADEHDQTVSDFLTRTISAQEALG